MRTFVTLLALGVSLAPAFAQDLKIGDLTIENAFARATPKGSEVGVGYMTIRNDGAAADRLASASSDFAKVQIHEMKMANGVMQMRELPNGLEIPAHGEVKLAPGGNHLMFVGLKAPLVKGQTQHVTLTFDHAGTASVDLPVQGPGAGAMAPMKGM